MDGSESLERFLKSQSFVYGKVVAELSRAQKLTHWMWFIFPQLRGLGRTTTSEHYGLASKVEACSYWEHPVLGARLKECTRLVLASPANATARGIFGSPDDLKLRSCMTLFKEVAPEEDVFGAVLRRFYGAQPDPLTLQLLLKNQNSDHMS